MRPISIHSDVEGLLGIKTRFGTKATTPSSLTQNLCKALEKKGIAPENTNK